jgi:hypothetical protein
MITRAPAMVQPATVALIRRAPTAPPAGIPQRAPRPDTVPAVARAKTMPTPDQRSTTTGPPAPASAATPRGTASLLDRVPVGLFERARAGLSVTTGRQAIPTGLATATDPAGQAPRPATGVVRRFRGFSSAVSPRSAMTDTDGRPTTSEAVADALTPREWEELVDLVVDKLEDRVRDELARRGRRFSPGVF